LPLAQVRAQAPALQIGCPPIARSAERR